MRKAIIDCSTRDYSMEIEAETLKLQGLDVLVSEAKASAETEEDHASIDAEADETRAIIQSRLDDFTAKHTAHGERFQIVEVEGEEKEMLLAQSAATQAAQETKEAAIQDLQLRKDKIQSGIDELSKNVEQTPVDVAVMETLKSSLDLIEKQLADI